MDAQVIIGNARKLGKDAFHTAVALELVASIPGRTWIALCCNCLEHVDPRWESPCHRIALELHHDAGGCSSCAYSGCDTLVVALPSAQITQWGAALSR